MKLVICHHHLNRGGVSRVIENHLRALATLDEHQQPSSVLVVYGGRAADWNFSLGGELPFELTYQSLPALEYDSENPKPSTSQQLAMDLLDVLSSHSLSIENSILHFHNHSLGKSAMLPAAIESLAKQGWRMLLQIHDFAEDLRPQNYVHMLETVGGEAELHRQLYPQAHHLHYATLNHRDHELLASAGIDSARLHKIPNPVVALGKSNGKTPHKTREAARDKLAACHGVSLNEPYILYPVRGIQRKNLGELLLWASLCREATFAITLPPMNSKELKFYDRWKALARDLSLRVLFEVGEALSLSENYAAADAIITTSIAEGFGLVYLEAALMNRPLLGRDLTAITEDFRIDGMRFPGLADCIHVPMSLVDRDSLRNTFTQHAVQLRDAFRLPQTDRLQIDKEFADLTDAETIDFARLDSATQETIIRQVNQDAELRLHLQERNPVTKNIMTTSLADEDQPSAQANREAIREHYSLRQIGQQLNTVYQAVQSSAPSGILESTNVARSLQGAFLRADQLYPLRLEQ